MTLSDGLIEGFERRRLPGDGVQIDALVGGSGPPLLLLHGWPQTRVCWAQVAPALTRHFTVVVPDLRGYGRSDKPTGGDDHSAYSKRTLARDQVATMAALGFARFAVVGHDRGGRVAYRLALDRPDVVSQLVVLDIIPTSDMWANFDARIAVKTWHWVWQIQPGGLAERMIGADPEFFLRYVLEQNAGPGFTFAPESLADYLACIHDPAMIRAICEDYRAGWTVDRELDEADKGRVRIAAPTLCLWGDTGIVAKSEPLGTWSPWCDEVSGRAVSGGHFIPEEAGAELTTALFGFLNRKER